MGSAGDHTDMMVFKVSTHAQSDDHLTATALSAFRAESSGVSQAEGLLSRLKGLRLLLASLMHAGQLNIPELLSL